MNLNDRLEALRNPRGAESAVSEAEGQSAEEAPVSVLVPASPPTPVAGPKPAVAREPAVQFPVDPLAPLKERAAGELFARIGTRRKSVV